MQGFTLIVEDAFCLRQHDRWQICKIFIKCVIFMAGFSFIFEDALCLRQHDRWQISIFSLFAKELHIFSQIDQVSMKINFMNGDKLYQT